MACIYIYNMSFLHNFLFSFDKQTIILFWLSPRAAPTMYLFGWRSQHYIFYTAWCKDGLSWSCHAHWSPVHRKFFVITIIVVCPFMFHANNSYFLWCSELDAICSMHKKVAHTHFKPCHKRIFMRKKIGCSRDQSIDTQSQWPAGW